MNTQLVISLIFIGLILLSFAPSMFTFMRRDRAYKHIKAGDLYIIDVNHKNPFCKESKKIYEIIDAKDEWIRYRVTRTDNEAYEDTGDWPWDKFILYHKDGKKVADLVIKQRKHEKNISKSN